ncbi:M1 family aminopeptidase [Agriterribacter sp.]|uniref:M1 family aminopeptidase n=1 Tax=Agriterribacter sp. TaxID=2821509 RepID=UPI002CB6781A|nr:M1 family aminopeptidase [Agriterribacter sp.]HRO46980.1 M1 family aminopeptidase [Agriterribacter sp.]HRQ18454.1 M1 family aminopeptidase [Agriterribacter sp.]
MKKLSGLLLIAVFPALLYAQTVPGTNTSPGIYRAAPEKLTNLVHTKLEARFDYEKAYMYGKVWITLEPHFYSTDSVVLDAKGMEIKAVAIVQRTATKPLKYTYDGLQINIRLDKTYGKGEEYKIYIDYTAKPNELAKGGSEAIKDDKGLYFINPLGEEKNKPTQIWTQGETESTSVWCPTIDKPNQKSTQEFFLIVPSKYVTLSNGKLLQQQKNADGTRTDYWKMDLPHAPYLFFIGIGDYAVIKDLYKGKEVSYYVEKEYAGVAKKIFGNTPEMIAFFEKITGVSYPWPKYAQMTARDYVSGAMENTTATLHQESAQQDSRQLLDGNAWENTIAHELFHHWFGDYVTAKSWSNLTVNESFANFSQVLWNEHKYGKDAGDAENYKNMQQYLSSPEDAKKPLVRFHYKDREDMFDLVSYQKGGRILNMLRNYLGDDAFYKGLNVYLTTHKFNSAEAHQLRLALEEISGRDLNWFFNQWYFGSGHPKLTIDYSYNDSSKTVSVQVKQTQAEAAFILPVAIDIYNGKEKKRHPVWVDQKDQTFTFTVAAQPDLVNFDGDKILLCEKKETGKSLANYIHQYTVAGSYVDRREAISGCAALQDSTAAVDLLKTALRDRYLELRIFALHSADLTKENVKQALESTIFIVAKGDPEPTVRAEALMALSLYDKPIYKELIQRSVNDSSYSVAGAALLSLNQLDKPESYTEAKKLTATKTKGKLAEAISNVFAENSKVEDLDYVLNWYNALPFGQAKVENANIVAYYAIQLQNTEAVKKATDALVLFRDQIPAAYQQDIYPFVNNVLLKTIANQKTAMKNVAADAAAIQEQVDYINSKIK